MPDPDFACPERPRERLLALGPGSLTDAELLAVLLRTGVPGRPVLDVARSLLQRFGGVGGVLAAGAAELRGLRGLGPARVAELKAMVEFVRRALLCDVAQRDALSSPEAVRDYLRLTMAPLPYEAFLVIFLDSQNRLLAARELFRGTLAQTSVYPREVVKAALEHNAAAVILAHNHHKAAAWPSPPAPTNC
jgi:DNA repair protein RadC